MLQIPIQLHILTLFGPAVEMVPRVMLGRSYNMENSSDKERFVDLRPELLDASNHLNGHGVQKLLLWIVAESCERPQRVCNLLRLEVLHGQDSLARGCLHQVLAGMVAQRRKCPKRVGYILQQPYILCMHCNAVTILWSLPTTLSPKTFHDT